mmetsp:Transcript_86495/g.245311  ORF Transcript_86495/g.245311 Transcript_86495/m.245311 type:complete len:236 (-) Transcript_86495:409-1116(-)
MTHSTKYGTRLWTTAVTKASQSQAGSSTRKGLLLRALRIEGTTGGAGGRPLGGGRSGTRQTAVIMEPTNQMAKMVPTSMKPVLLLATSHASAHVPMHWQKASLCVAGAGGHRTEPLRTPLLSQTMQSRAGSRPAPVPGARPPRRSSKVEFSMNALGCPALKKPPQLRPARHSEALCWSETQIASFLVFQPVDAKLVIAIGRPSAISVPMPSNRLDTKKRPVRSLESSESSGPRAS